MYTVSWYDQGLMLIFTCAYSGNSKCSDFVLGILLLFTERNFLDKMNLYCFSILPERY